MKRILAVVHSYYMLLVVLQLKNTVYKDAQMDLILSDSTRESARIYKKIVESNIFGKCFYYKHQDFYDVKQSRLSAVSFLIKEFLTPNSILSRCGINIEGEFYDKLLLYVPDRLEEQVIYSALKKVNKDVKCELYEEGFPSYLDFNGILRGGKNGLNYSLFRKFDQIFCGGKIRIGNNVDRIWLFEPKLIQYSTDIEVCGIPKISVNDSHFLSTVNSIFDYEKSKVNEKYLFLESCYIADGNESDENDIVSTLIKNKAMNRDDIIAKLHPRSKINQFEEGINLLKAEAPLEVLIMNGDCNDKTYLTYVSGALISSVLAIETNIDTKLFFLYKCSKLDVEVKDEALLKFFEAVKKIDGIELFIPENTKELEELLKND